MCSGKRLAGLRGGRPAPPGVSGGSSAGRESPDPAHGVGPIIDGLLQAFQPSGRGELGLDVSPTEYRAMEIGRIRWGCSH